MFIITDIAIIFLWLIRYFIHSAENRQFHVNICLDGGRQEFANVIDEKDSDFVSPVQARFKKKPKLGGLQAQLNIDKNGNFVVKKPQGDLPTINEISKTSFKDIDEEISASRISIGIIETKIAELEKMRDQERKNLARLVKKRTQKMAQCTVLIGYEDRPLSQVITRLFPRLYTREKRQLYAFGEICHSSYYCIDDRQQIRLWEMSKLQRGMENAVEDVWITVLT